MVSNLRNVLMHSIAVVYDLINRFSTASTVSSSLLVPPCRGGVSEEDGSFCRGRFGWVECCGVSLVVSVLAPCHDDMVNK